MSWARFIWRTLVAIIVVAGGAGCASGATDDVLRSMHVPDGFAVEVAAKPPLLRHPMWACCISHVPAMNGRAHHRPQASDA
jgi:hypothetical protein